MFGRNPDTRTYATLFIHGRYLYVRFDDRKSYDIFKSKVDSRVTSLQVIYCEDNSKWFVRPSSVDCLTAPLVRK